jgi:hypothetical protein
MPLKSTLELGFQDFQEAFTLGLARGSRLLTAGENVIAVRIQGLAGEAGRAFCWLHQRKPSIYFEPELDLAGFADWESARRRLAKLDLIDSFVPWSTRAAHLPLRILRVACAERDLEKHGNHKLLEQRLATEVGWLQGRWLRLRHRGLVERLLRFGLLRTRPDLAQRTVERLRDIRWPDYTPDSGIVLFRDRRSLRSWEELTATLEELSPDALVRALRQGDGVAPGRLDRSRKLRRRLFEIARQQERAGELRSARRSYEALCQLHPAGASEYQHRWARCLELEGEPRQALAVLRRARSGTTGTDRMGIVRAGKRIARACNEGFPPDIPLMKAPIRHFELPPGSRKGVRPTFRIAGTDRHVEAAIASLLGRSRRCAIHGEGRLWTMIFALVFAERVSFLPIPGQLPIRGLSGPLDIGTPAFFRRREAAIGQTLQMIRDGHAAQLIRSSYATFEGYQLAGVDWSLARLDDLCSLTSGLGPKPLISILERLLHEGWSAARGLPDLIVLPGDPVELPSFPRHLDAGLYFVEVKGPTDTLQDAQRLWLHILLSHSLNVEVWQARVSRGLDT